MAGDLAEEASLIACPGRSVERRTVLLRRLELLETSGMSHHAQTKAAACYTQLK